MAGGSEGTRSGIERYCPANEENHMIEIVLAVCAIQQPAQCKDVRLTYLAENVTPAQCIRYGQPEIAKWLESNPKWGVMRWKCAPARNSAKA
jgi:hypothetical protein